MSISTDLTDAQQSMHEVARQLGFTAELPNGENTLERKVGRMTLLLGHHAKYLSAFNSQKGYLEIQPNKEGGLLFYLGEKHKWSATNLQDGMKQWPKRTPRSSYAPKLRIALAEQMIACEAAQNEAQAKA